jgi:ABC-type bacteriocin/lantibiotic exporter with double-glycine peptidase domain
MPHPQSQGKKNFISLPAMNVLFSFLTARAFDRYSGVMQQLNAHDNAIISLRGVHKAFGPKVILNNISLDILQGEVLLIIGKSGTGKSVILKNMSGLMEPDAGTILIQGEPLPASPA